MSETEPIRSNAKRWVCGYRCNSAKKGLFSV